MGIDQDDVKAVKTILWSDETVGVTVRQRRIGPGGALTTPTSVIATDKRIIILNRATLGIRQDYETIPYRQITSVRLEHGIISSSVFIRVQGYSTDQGLLKNGDQEGEIDGLNNTDAKALSDFISKRLEDTPESEGTGGVDTNATPGSYIYCTKCGMKNLSSSQFCSKCGVKLR